MSDVNNTNVPPGWYPDPTDGSWQRWWDGSSWTEHAAPSVASTPATEAGGAAAPAYGQTTQLPAAPAAPATPLRTDIQTNTVWIWLVVLLPLVMLPTIFLIDWRSYIESSIDLSTPGGATANPMLPSMGPVLASLALSAVGYVIAGAGILFAWLDWRELKRRGIVKPFHWAWAFLALVVTNGVYVIGRGVVLRRQTGKGLVPVWAWIAVTVLSLIVGVVYAGVIMGQVFELIRDQTRDMQFS